VIAVQLYTIRSELGDASRLGGVLGRLREIGYRAVEVAGVGPVAIDRFGEVLRRAELTACAAHVPLERLRDDLDTVAAQCSDWGCEYVVIPSVPDADRSPEGFRRFAREAGETAQRLQVHGLRLAYHNHAFELERYGDRTGLETLFDAWGDAVRAELDTYWLQFGGVNPAAWIRRFKGRVPLVHMKDMAVDRGSPVDAEVGEGNLDWIDILGACREAGAKWLVVEQDNPRGDPMESVALSHSNLTALAAKFGWGG
jgi:sugar phosphate isomerase/epimerase